MDRTGRIWPQSVTGPLKKGVAVGVKVGTAVAVAVAVGVLVEARVGVARLVGRGALMAVMDDGRSHPATINDTISKKAAVWAALFIKTDR